jgi:hypothetical protein
MSIGRSSWRVTLLLIFVTVGAHADHAQDQTPVEQAQRVVGLLGAEQFDDVVKEFNAQMTAALPAAQLREVWSMLRQQVGAFTAVVDERVATPGGGMTVVTLGCEFEKAALNVMWRSTPRRRSEDCASFPAQPQAQRPPPHQGRLGSRRRPSWSVPATGRCPERSRYESGALSPRSSWSTDRDRTIATRLSGPTSPSLLAVRRHGRLVEESNRTAVIAAEDPLFAELDPNRLWQCGKVEVLWTDALRNVDAANVNGCKQLQ